MPACGNEAHGQGPGGEKVTYVRKAGPNDATTLSKMNNEFNHLRIKPKDIHKKLNRGSEIVLVAEVDGKLSGFACAQIMDSFCYTKPYAEMTELFVRATSRRMGVGKALVGAIEKELLSRGVSHIHILTGMKNKSARALYEKLRYSDHKERREVLYDKNMKS
ncbi:MAG: GNAT family N-acetyltransferase [Candidatus Bathyarchaeia archaeon]|jgi:ribosomal protein S18 acetylase RimI-like enzyme